MVSSSVVPDREEPRPRSVRSYSRALRGLGKF